jgi:lipopolysaccharide transport system ATP-binding protein
VSETAISVRGLGKRYRIGKRVRPYKRLTETVTDMFAAPFLRLAKATGAAAPEETIWALKDVSFDVRPGEVVGIIGRNGAGKSTLLKVLNRITEPTDGEATIRGRVGSLLEVGTGFHPELTGRENTFLNGTILGMRRDEIRRKFDEIIAFAEIDKFIDTPVKYYSSGMYVRLAFAVAAHLETDILFVDEVLAVGDSQFQKKCLGKMGEVASGGRTVLFVSHNLGAVRRICQNGLLLDRGRLVHQGPVAAVVDEYVRSVAAITRETSLRERTDRDGDGRLRFVDARWESEAGEPLGTLRSGSDVVLALTFERPDSRTCDNVVVSFGVRDPLGERILLHNSDFDDVSYHGIEGQGHFRCHIHKLPLAAGDYTVDAFVGTRSQAYDSIYDVLTFRVEPGDFYASGHPGQPELCKLLIDCRWELQT